MMYGMTIIPHTIFKNPDLSTFLLQEHHPSLEQFAITSSLHPAQSRLTPLRPSCRTSSYNCLPYFQLSIVTFNCTFISWHATVRLCTRWWTELYVGFFSKMTIRDKNTIVYLTFCMLSFEYKESSLSDTRCLIQYVVSPHCGDKRMARSCTRSSLPNYFVISLKYGVQHVNVSNVNKAIEWRATNKRDVMHKMLSPSKYCTHFLILFWPLLFA